MPGQSAVGGAFHNWRAFIVSKTDTGRRHNGLDEQDATNQYSNPVNPYNIYPFNVGEIHIFYICP